MNNTKNMRFAWVTDTLIMAKRNLLKTKHNPEKLFDVTLQPAIMMIMFTYLMGGAISGSVDSYLPIIITTTATATATTTTTTTTTNNNNNNN